MTDTITKALTAISPLPDRVKDFRMGDRVVQWGDEDTVLYITSFLRNGSAEYQARCIKLGTSEVLELPVSSLKPSRQPTLH